MYNAVNNYKGHQMVASEPKCSHCITVSELMTLHDTALLVSNSQDLVGSLEKALLILKSRLHLEKCAIHTLLSLIHI